MIARCSCERWNCLPEWFLARHLGLEVDRRERTLLDRLFESLVETAESQPSCFVHRDYHSRNLLVTESNNPAYWIFKTPYGVR